MRKKNRFWPCGHGIQIQTPSIKNKNKKTASDPNPHSALNAIFGLKKS